MMLMKLSAKKMLSPARATRDSCLARQRNKRQASQAASRRRESKEGARASQRRRSALALSPARALGSPSSALPARSHLAPPHPLTHQVLMWPHLASAAVVSALANHSLMAVSQAPVYEFPMVASVSAAQLVLASFVVVHRVQVSPE